MTVEELLSILKCPPTVESGERGRESESKRAWRTRRARQTETERETERVRERGKKIGHEMTTHMAMAMAMAKETKCPWPLQG